MLAAAVAVGFDVGFAADFAVAVVASVGDPAAVAGVALSGAEADLARAVLPLCPLLSG